MEEVKDFKNQLSEVDVAIDKLFEFFKLLGKAKHQP